MSVGDEGRRRHGRAVGVAAAVVVVADHFVMGRRKRDTGERESIAAAAGCLLRGKQRCEGYMTAWRREDGYCCCCCRENYAADLNFGFDFDSGFGSGFDSVGSDSVSKRCLGRS